MKNHTPFILALTVSIALALGCSKNFSCNFGNAAKSKLYFCENYIVGEDRCEGNSKKFTQGALTVMLDLRPENKTIGVSEVDINITDLGTGEVENTFGFDTDPSSDYLYFENVKFLKSGKFRVSALKPDGTVIVSSQIEIVDG